MRILPPAVGGVGTTTPGFAPGAESESPRYDALRPRPPHEGVVWLPIAMFRDRTLSGTPWAIAAHMAVACPKSSFRYWRSVDDLAEACGVSPSAVRQGIARLKAAGWIHQVVDVVRKKPRTVFVLAWRLPDVPAHLPTMGPARQDPAQDSVRSAQDSAPPPGPPYKDESYRERETLTLTRAREGTGSMATPTPPPPAVPEPRAAPGVSLAPERPTAPTSPPSPPNGPPAASEPQILEWLADLRRPRVPGIVRNAALWGLEDAGRLPEEFAGKVPPRPQERPQAPPATPPRAAPPRPPTTVELIARLADPSGPEAIAATARKLAEEWGDLHSLKFHEKWMGKVASGELPKSIPEKLYRSLRNAHPETRRRTFGSRIGEAMAAHEKPAAGASRQSSPAAGLNQSIR